MSEFNYARGATNMIADSDEHEGVICNPKGINGKLVVQFSMDGGILFEAWVDPRFPVFDDLLKIAGKSLDKVEDAFEMDKLDQKFVKFGTKITKADNGNEYCNLTFVKPLDKDAPAKVVEAPAETPAEPVVEEKTVDAPPFPDEEKKVEAS